MFRPVLLIVITVAKEKQVTLIREIYQRFQNAEVGVHYYTNSPTRVSNGGSRSSTNGCQKHFRTHDTLEVVESVEGDPCPRPHQKVHFGQFMMVILWYDVPI